MKNKTKVSLVLISLMALGGCNKNISSSSSVNTKTSYTSSEVINETSSSSVESSTSANEESSLSSEVSSSIENSSSEAPSSSSESSSSSSSDSSSALESSSSSSSSSSSGASSVTPTNPTITVESDLRININEHINYLTLVSAVDTIDGNITHLVTVELPNNVEMINGDLYFQEVGIYTITFHVTNSSSLSSSASINIEVYRIEDKDFTGPTILGAKNIRVKPNVLAYPLEGITAIDDIDGDVTSSLTATHQTDGDATNGISFIDEGEYEVIIKAKDSSNNYSQVTITIEVNSEDVPTFVDITEALVKEYNCNVGDSDEVPFTGAKSKIITVKHDSQNTKYANAKFVFTPTEDLNNKKLSFYFKMGDNVTGNKMGFYLMRDGNKLVSDTILNSATTSTGYSVIDQGNGWYQVNIAINKKWPSLDSYIVDSIRISFANTDVTKTATVYIANVLLDDYKEGDDLGGSGNEGGGTINPTPTSDLSDAIIPYTDYTTVSTDSTVSHDGVQSTKIQGVPTSTYQYTQGRYNFDSTISSDNLKISFFVKLDGTNIYRNRIVVRVCTTNNDQVEPKIYLDGSSSNPDGVTVSPSDSNGWYQVTIDCNTLSFESKTIPSGSTIKYIRFGVEASDRDTDKTIEPIFWIDELSYTYETTGSDTPVDPDTPVTPEPGTPEVTGNDVSDEIKVGDNASCSIDTTVSHDGVQSMKVTGKSYTEQGSSAYAALAFYYLSDTISCDNFVYSFYVKLDGTNIYKNRLNLRVETNTGIRYEPQVLLDSSSQSSGITVVPADSNGWYHVTVDCRNVSSIAGETVKYIRFSVDPADKNDNKVIEPVIWIDELIISGGEA